MNNYAIFKMGKLKTEKDLSDAFKHNERIFHVLNADPSKIQDNVELIDSYGVSYEDLYNQTLTDLKIKGTLQNTVRKDAVKGFEVILTFSRERTDDIDINEWAKESMDWIDENFNPPEHKITHTNKTTGETKEYRVQNIKHAILHMDESKPHLHAFVVPIDDKGHLNSHYYNCGRQHFIELQTDYAKKMEKFGLERGTQNTVATPIQMSRYYNYITKAVEATLPEPNKGESVEEYKKRAEETVYQPTLCTHRNEMVKKEQEIIKIKSEADKKAAVALENAQKEHLFYNEVCSTYGHLEEDAPERERKIIKIIKDAEEIEKYKQEHPEDKQFENAQKLIDDSLRRERERHLR